ncbi:hypothetical protein BDP55DRAFT_661993 [Colletotrichum godetiae]|uniref:Secreted protein n=1 Tax=Colletotrichum godetiae TaxID=1209918 RepID=A0AAJ0EUH7_9PEZI|nr:uncharacterized protein BDP55DRAFT_661993 [Colletotrichum godetiae]KAK1676207.1 hypothetical protein BDP55DRAFT_661993 [Colletotrichum godetiae]
MLLLALLPLFAITHAPNLGPRQLLDALGRPPTTAHHPSRSASTPALLSTAATTIFLPAIQNYLQHYLAVMCHR